MQISIKEAPVNKLKEVKAYYRGNVIVRTRLISLGEGGSAPLVLFLDFKRQFRPDGEIFKGDFVRRRDYWAIATMPFFGRPFMAWYHFKNNLSFYRNN